MRRRLQLLLLVLANVASITGASAQRTTRVAVDAQVFDAAGNPVAGAEFADRWSFRADRWIGQLGCVAPEKSAPLRSDQDGILRGEWTMDPFGTPLFGLSPDRRSAVFVAPEFDPVTHEAVVRGRIVLKKAVSLRGTLRTSLGAEAARPVQVRLVFPRPRHPEHPAFAVFSSGDHKLALPLPPATYSLSVQYGHGQSAGRTAVLAPGAGVVDMGPISINLMPFDLLGEVFPDWELRGAENIAVDQANLAQFRGRPLLVCFDEWGGRLNTGAGVREGLAALVGRVERGEFGVVLFDSSTRVAGQGGQPPAPVVEQMFPLIKPALGKNSDVVYGSRWAMIVLDREGRLVHCGRDVEGAVAVLDRVLASSASTQKPPRRSGGPPP